MRPIYPGDLDLVTRTLLACDARNRRALAQRIVQQAQTADRYRKRLGKPHPAFGTGSLISAAQGFPRKNASGACNGAYLASLAVLIQTLQSATRDDSL